MRIAAPCEVGVTETQFFLMGLTLVSGLLGPQAMSLWSWVQPGRAEQEEEKEEKEENQQNHT